MGGGWLSKLSWILTLLLASIMSFRGLINPACSGKGELRPQRIFVVSCHHVGAKTWPHPTTCRVQCWDASGQMTKRVGPQPHPSADCLPKVVLGVQQPLNTPLDSRGTRLTSTHSGQAPVSPTRKPGQASGLTSTTRGQTPEARELTSSPRNREN